MPCTGGTAINLFIRDMPRLSVDIDLTYIHVEDRETSLRNIAEALQRISSNIIKRIRGAEIDIKREEGKLNISQNGVTVKVEVNIVMRGIISQPENRQLCQKAQDEFDAFCEISTVPLGQLFGGKICAALDRQHPRDLFDVKFLLEKEGFTEEVKTGFLYCLLSSVRPIHEILNPHLLDQTTALENQFSGMSNKPFDYAEFERVRKELVQTVRKNLTRQDKDFLINVKSLTPDWSIYDFGSFPAVAWKLQNLQKLKDNNSKKYASMLESTINCLK